MEKLSDKRIEELNDPENWSDSEETSMMWELISQGMIHEFLDVVQENSKIAHVRSADGRGPMWWAHEYKRPKMIQVLRKMGVSETRKDVNGIRPTDLS